MALDMVIRGSWSAREISGTREEIVSWLKAHPHADVFVIVGDTMAQFSPEEYMADPVPEEDE